MDPLGALIGSALLGAGALFVFGAVKNKRILGTDGILSSALSKGSITSLANVPDAFPAGASDIVGKMVAKQPRGPEETQDAVRAISAGNASLANNITAQLELVDVTSTRASLMPLAQLLAVADAQGFTVSTGIIRAYVKEVTDESI
jgi:hypothetical protein